MLTFLACSVSCLANAAPAAAQSIPAAPGSIGLRASDCLVPGVVAWYSGNAISNGLGYNPCPNPIPLPAPAPSTPASPPPEAAVTPPPPSTEDVPPVTVDASPTPETPSQAVVVAPPPPPERIPVAVPTYAPWTATNGPGSNGVGSGNGTASYNNPYNTLAPSARAALGSGDWCRRSGRSKSVVDACLKSVEGR